MRELTKIVRNTMLALMFGYFTAMIVINMFSSTFKFLVIACIFYTAFLMTSMIGQIASVLHTDSLQTPVLSTWIARKVVGHPNLSSLDDAEFYEFILEAIHDCQYAYNHRIK